MLLTNVETPTELMSIALQAEREAIRRYTSLTIRMREANNESAARLFERMVEEEIQHEALLLQWMSQEGIQEDPNISPVKWADPQVSTEYNDDARSAYHSTPYRALAFAVHNEEIAFRFYTHVAAHSKNEIVRQHAETLAREELGHASLLRAERRKAFHAERDTHTEEPRLDASTITNEVDLLAAAIHIDNYLLEQMQLIKNNTPAIAPLLDQSQQYIADNEAALEVKKNKDQLIPSEDITSNLQKLKQHNAYMQNKFDQPGQETSRLWACCDRSFAFYDAIVESTEDEKVMLAAQGLTAIALDRIGFLKQILGDEEK
jgi:rubrerythrin